MENWQDRQDRPSEDNRRYVLGIVSKKIADWYRARDNRCVGLEDVDWPADEPTPADTCDESAVFSAVRDLLDSQPDRRRAVGVLFFLEQWNHAEIAATLAMHESTVRTHLHRLRLLLKPLIDRINDLNPGGDQQ